jgi:hypothetical protein
MTAYGKFPEREVSIINLAHIEETASMCYPPTLEEASVRELRVLDLPALGLPTKPIRGSLPILKVFQVAKNRSEQLLVLSLASSHVQGAVARCRDDI